jgi:alkylhydroperoxidase family enzyme
MAQRNDKGIKQIMPWIKQISAEEATGLLKKEFDKAIQRAGRLWHIVHIMSLNPRVLRTSMDQYSAIMHGRSPLSRAQREMLATVVAVENDCYY